MFNINADKITVDSKIYKNVTFPFPVTIKRGFSDTVVKAEKKGYNPAMIYVDKTFNGVSILSILCGVVPVAIDAATGAMMKPEHKLYEVDFTPIGD